MARLIFSVCFVLFAGSSIDCAAQTIDHTKPEVNQDQKILHLKGSAYEIGYQHGTLLKTEIAHNVFRFVNRLTVVGRSQPPVIKHYMEALPTIIPHIPLSMIEEMQGIADGADIPYDRILLLNLFPEMFHCTGITVNKNASRDGRLYHVRVLDYDAANGLQDTAVLMVVEPNEGHPFLNVTYAGFIGCVTGMNKEKIAIGEIGDRGYGYWDGLPMSFMMRTILQHASSLDEIREILNNTSRTCSYYYVFSDGKTAESVGVYATHDILQFIEPGTRYYKFPTPADNFNAKKDPKTDQQLILPDAFFSQLSDCLMITRWDRFDLLSKRMKQFYGHLGVAELQEVIKKPLAVASNLHNAIFAPETLEVWISHAGPNNEPACDQPYVYYNLLTLLGE